MVRDSSRPRPNFFESKSRKDLILIVEYASSISKVEGDLYLRHDFVGDVIKNRSENLSVSGSRLSYVNAQVGELLGWTYHSTTH
jgi:hypothetical protein